MLQVKCDDEANRPDEAKIGPSVKNGAWCGKPHHVGA